MDLTDPEEVIPVLKGLIRDLVKLHESGFIHRDIKRGNLVIDKDKNGNFTTKLFSDEQEPQDMLKILGY